MVKLSISGILGIILLLLLAGCSQGDLAGEAYKRNGGPEEIPDTDGGGGSGSFWVPGEQGGRRHITFLLNPGIKFKEAVDTNDQDVSFTNVEMDLLHVEKNVEIEGNLIMENSDAEIRSERFCDGSGNNCLEINSDSPPFNQWEVNSGLDLEGNLNVQGTLIAEGDIEVLNNNEIRSERFCDSFGESCFKLINPQYDNAFWKVDADVTFEDNVDIVGKLKIKSLVPGQAQVYELEVGQTAAYACIDINGKLFRSDVTCDNVAIGIEEE